MTKNRIYNKSYLNVHTCDMCGIPGRTVYVGGLFYWLSAAQAQVNSIQRDEK